VGLLAAVLTCAGATLLAAAPPATAQPGTTTFGFTGGPQTFTVPAGVTTINVAAAGAQGGAGIGGFGYGTPGTGGAAVPAATCPRRAGAEVARPHC
jgi:hypothetical protein